jgi:hypothetical protein
MRFAVGVPNAASFPAELDFPRFWNATGIFLRRKTESIFDTLSDIPLRGFMHISIWESTDPAVFLSKLYREGELESRRDWVMDESKLSEISRERIKTCRKRHLNCIGKPTGYTIVRTSPKMRRDCINRLLKISRNLMWQAIPLFNWRKFDRKNTAVTPGKKPLH